MTLRFTKMHGLGNDFVVIDAINQQVALDADKVRFLASRHFGVGCDQVLIVEPPQHDEADFHYRIFNADGGEVEQCGNGARCFARFVRDKGLTNKSRIRVETRAGLLTLQVESGGLITVDMGRPRFEPEAIPFDSERRQDSYLIDVAGEQISAAVLSMGNPHAVIEVDRVTLAPVAELGALLECHARFPQHVNVGFMEIRDRSHIRLRVYERGAGETLACGSGACAAVVAGRIQGKLDERVSVELSGGHLLVQWPGGEEPVMMTGPATTVFEGEIAL